MILERKAPAKINLGLHVLRKRADGYHDIETVLLRIGLHDTLRIAPAEAFSFTCSDASLPVNEDNLCVKAVHMLTSRCEVVPAFTLHLEKHVPYGAGLGGGSSDAAHTLLLVNEFLDLGASQDDLHSIASQLGSDVPFFLGGSSALGTGRGEILTPLLHNDGSEYLLPYHLLLAVPPVHVSTQEAYQYVEPNEISRPDLSELVLKESPREWCARLVNDFEASVFKTYPLIEQVKDHLYEAGAIYAAMSGSGSSVFGLFKDEGKCIGAAKMLQREGIKIWTEAPHSETL